jgi:protein-tyrosine phosphatase
MADLSGNDKATGVLFVCTGNICRSPTAEGLLRARLKAHGLEKAVFTESAGMHGYHIGDPPDPRSVAIAAARGIDIASLRAAKIAPKDFMTYDLIVALDEGHLEILERMHPGKGTRAKLRLLMSFADKGTGDVPDPYYLDEAAFIHAFDLIERGVDGLVQHLKEQYPP